ncbi:MAG: RNA pseudouridine synthase [Paludibacteraceae bacterium]|nr:RNA pseudouridine synthase [Paludibacteraceae bacterium]
MTILYEDNHIIAVNKTCNEIVQGDKTGDKPLLDIVKDYIKQKYDKPGEVFLGLPHRLDRPTSGVVLFAKTSKALVRLNAMFQTHDQIRKIYWAITANCPEEAEGRLVHYLRRVEKENKSYVVKNAEKIKALGKLPKEVKEARLNYRLLTKSERYYLWEIELETGRHHQIRCQLAAIGCPIKGDLKYGAPRSNPDGGISLHAREISFIHPVRKERITITAPVPDDTLWQALSPSDNAILDFK